MGAVIMRSRSGTRKGEFRRLATVMAAVGAMLASSGIALMVMTTTASAVPDKPPTDQVCVALDSGKIDVAGNHETLELTAPAGMLIDQYCVKAGSIEQGNGPEYVDVVPPQETVTISHSSGKDISHYSLSYVVDEEEPELTTAEVTWVDPDCDNENVADYATSGEHATFAVTAGSVAPGATVEITATANEGYEFEEGMATMVFTHTFGPEELNCTVEPPIVEPPVVEPPTVVVEPPVVDPPEATTDTVTPTVVSAGLAGEAATGTHDEGVALVLAGLLLLAGAGTVLQLKEVERLS